MAEKTLKQNMLALSFAVVVMVLSTSVTTFAEDLDAGVRAALDRGDTTTAMSLLDKQIDLDKGYYYNYYIKGRVLYNQRKYQQALEQLKIAVDKKDKHWDSVEFLGRTLMKLGRFEDAQKLFERGIKKGKEDAHRFEYLFGLVQMEKKHYDSADVAFRKALTVDSLNADYHIALGDANFYNGIPALAVMEYEKAQALDTASTEVYFHWADACLEMRDYQCAMDKLRLVLSKDSTHADAWQRAGGIYFRAARSSRAPKPRERANLVLLEDSPCVSL